MKIDSLQTSVNIQARYAALSNGVGLQEMNSPSTGSTVNSLSLETFGTKGDVSSVGSDSLGLEKSRTLVQQANALLKMSSSDIEFKVDEESGKAVFYIKDVTSGEVLRQIPSEAMLRLNKNIEQFLEGASQLSSSNTQHSILSGLLTDKKV